METQIDGTAISLSWSALLGYAGMWSPQAGSGYVLTHVYGCPME